jgi:antitoxin component YwqK of YwqJK toxin-antitoxin module
MDIILEYYKTYIDDNKYVYYSCDNYIIILEKLADTITNEDRLIYNGNSLYAQHRATKLKVILIFYKFEPSKCIDEITHKPNIRRIIYKTNNTLISNINGKITNHYTLKTYGLPYFKSIYSAFSYYLFDFYLIKNKNGILESYYSNGNVYDRRVYVDNKLNGEYVRYYDDNTIMKKINFIDNNLNGEYSEYDIYGNILIKMNYKNNKLNGDYLLYNFDGEIYSRTTYIDNIII